MSEPNVKQLKLFVELVRKHAGLSHRELMTGLKSDVQSDALKDLMQRLVAMNTAPALPEARQGEEEGEEPEEQPGAASSSTTRQSEQNWWQGWQGWQGAWDPESAVQVIRTEKQNKKQNRIKGQHIHKRKRQKVSILLRSNLEKFISVTFDQHKSYGLFSRTIQVLLIQS